MEAERQIRFHCHEHAKEFIVRPTATTKAKAIEEPDR
jgi:hypothetical protein